MGEHTFSYQPVALGQTSSSYWRRRCLVLVVGLSLFAMAAWSLSQALQVRPAAARSAGSPRGQGPAGTGGAAKGHGGRATAKHGHGASQHGASQHGAGNHAAGRRAGSGSPSPTTSPAGHGFRGFSPAFCSWHSIVLSLSAAQITFGPHQAPGFSLSVVSTQRKPCSFNVGSAHLALVVKEGPVRIWSSADCASGTSGLVTALRRGVPTIVTITWHRRTSAPGCATPARQVPPGIYTGYAVDGSIASVPVTFKVS